MASGASAKSVGPYLVLKKVGTGSFASVWHARHKTSGQEVAIKAISTEKLNKKLTENLDVEISIQRSLEHPNVVKLLDILRTERTIYLILEFCAGGDLSKFIRRRGPLPEEFAKHLLRQLARGLDFLRRHSLIHRDLKPQNLLLSSDGDDATLKIADFGFARYIDKGNLAETLCGSPLYMAPEILRFQKYDAKADLWSVGTIIFELLTGRPPFTGTNHIQLLHNIEQTAELKFPDTLPLSQSTMSLLRSLLRRNPVERCSFEDFFKHPLVGLIPSPQPPTMLLLSGSSAASGPSTASALVEMHPSPDVLSPAVAEAEFADTQLAPAETGKDHGEIRTSPANVEANNLHFDHSSFSTSHSDADRESGGAHCESSPSNDASVNRVPIRQPRTNPFKSESSAPSRRTLTDSLDKEYVMVDAVPGDIPATASVRPCQPREQEQPVDSVPDTRSAVPSRRETSASSASSALFSYPNIPGVQTAAVSIPQSQPLSMPGLGSPVAGTGLALGPPWGGAEEDKLVVALDWKARNYKLVRELADAYSEGGRWVDATALYVRALHILQGALLIAQQFVGNFTTSAGRVSVFQWLKERFIEVAEKAEECRSLAQSSFTSSESSTGSGAISGCGASTSGEVASTTQRQRQNAEAQTSSDFPDRMDAAADSSTGSGSGSVCVERLLYERALQLGREGAVDELMGNALASCNSYTRAIQLLDLVSAEGAISEADRATLRSYMVRFGARLQELRKSVKPGAPRVLGSPSQSPHGLSRTSYG